MRIQAQTGAEWSRLPTRPFRPRPPSNSIIRREVTHWKPKLKPADEVIHSQPTHDFLMQFVCIWREGVIKGLSVSNQSNESPSQESKPLLLCRLIGHRWKTHTNVAMGAFGFPDGSSVKVTKSSSCTRCGCQNPNCV